MKDLVVLATDKDLEFAIRGLLARPQALGIRPLRTEIFVEPEHDPACALRGVGFLANFSKQFRRALLMFDHEGSGKESVPRDELQKSLDEEFGISAWGGRGKAIVLEPELEAWIWSDSPYVDEAAGWKERAPGLRSWLIENGWLVEGASKPSRPKEAFEAALRKAGKPRSSSLYQQVAAKVSFRRCTDPAFREFKEILGLWFSAP